MESNAVLREPTVIKLEEDAGAMRTNSTDIGTTSTGIVRTDERTENRPVGTTVQPRQESGLGFHGGERNDGVDFDKEQEPGDQKLETDENLNGLSTEDKNRSPETEDIRARDSLIESNADGTKPKLGTQAVEDYDAETVIKNQQMYYLYCPCCGKDITKTVRVVRKLEIQPENGRKDFMLRFPVRISLWFASLFGRKKQQKGEEKVDPKPSPASVVDISNWRLKTTVQNFLSWFLHIVALLFLYTIALLFLYIFALWFLFISPEELPSTSSPHFVSIFALLFLAILALWFHFNPGSDEKKDGEKVKSESSSPSKVGDKLGTTDLDQVSDQKQGNNKPVHSSGDDEPSRLQSEGGVSSPSRSPSGINFVDEEGKHTEPSHPHELKPDDATEPGSAGTSETEPNSLPTKPQIPINVPGKGDKVEILKSVVYGGLIESITSLGMVSSAAGSGASTLKIFAMGLANLSSGLMLIVHNLLELRKEKPRRTATTEKEDRYEQLLGRRERFYLHVFIVILSFIVFGIIPPLVYGFSFRRTDKRHYKAAAVLAASLVCIVSLAIAKAYISKTREYFKTVLRYAKLAIGASGVSYIVGDFVNDLLEKYGRYDDSAEARQR